MALATGNDCSSEMLGNGYRYTLLLGACERSPCQHAFAPLAEVACNSEACEALPEKRGDPTARGPKRHDTP